MSATEQQQLQECLEALVANLEGIIRQFHESKDSDVKSCTELPTDSQKEFKTRTLLYSDVAEESPLHSMSGAWLHLRSALTGEEGDCMEYYHKVNSEWLEDSTVLEDYWRAYYYLTVALFYAEVGGTEKVLKFRNEIDVMFKPDDAKMKEEWSRDPKNELCLPEMFLIYYLLFQFCETVRGKSEELEENGISELCKTAEMAKHALLRVLPLKHGVIMYPMMSAALPGMDDVLHDMLTSLKKEVKRLGNKFSWISHPVSELVLDLYKPRIQCDKAKAAIEELFNYLDAMRKKEDELYREQYQEQHVDDSIEREYCEAEKTEDELCREQYKEHVIEREIYRVETMED